MVEYKIQGFPLLIAYSVPHDSFRCFRLNNSEFMNANRMISVLHISWYINMSYMCESHSSKRISIVCLRNVHIYCYFLVWYFNRKLPFWKYNIIACSHTVRRSVWTRGTGLTKQDCFVFCLFCYFRPSHFKRFSQSHIFPMILSLSGQNYDKMLYKSVKV